MHCSLCVGVCDRCIDGCTPFISQALLEELSARLKRRSELESQLFDAFQENDIEAVRSFLDKLGPNDAKRVINSTPSGISTLLYRASHTGRV